MLITGKEIPSPLNPSLQTQQSSLGGELQNSAAKGSLQGKKDSLMTGPSQRATGPGFHQGLKQKGTFKQVRK